LNIGGEMCPVPGPGTGGDSRAAPASVWELLPAFYRESAGVLRELVAAVDDVLEGFQRQLAAAEDSVLRKGTAVLDAGLPGRSRRGRCCGTEDELRRLLESTSGAPVRIFAGFLVTPRQGGWLEFRRSRTRSAVLVWERGSMGAEFAPPAPHRERLPVVTGLQAVVAQRSAPRRTPLPGERIQGSVCWEIGPDSPVGKAESEERK
jgi:hypothetical protein